MKKMLLLSGVPGSGKSYFSKLIKEKYNNSHIYIVSSDDIRTLVGGNPQNFDNETLIWKMYYDLAVVYSSDPNGIVILDSTNTRSKYRIDIFEKMKEYFDEIDLVIFNIPRNIALKQNKSRKWVVPSEAMEMMLSKFELPSEEEEKSFNNVYIVDKSNFNDIVKKI